MQVQKKEEFGKLKVKFPYHFSLLLPHALSEAKDLQKNEERRSFLSKKPLRHNKGFTQQLALSL